MAGRAPRVRRARPLGRSLRFAIVAARFNERITQRLVNGALTTGVPATFGVVTALSEEQAWARAGGEVANRGEEAAEAALAMAEWIDRLRHDATTVRPAKSARAELRAPLSGHPRLLRPRGTRLMGTRRGARQGALQFLYQLDLQGEDDPVPHEQEFWARHLLSDEAKTFAETLVRGTKANQAKIDQVIEQYTENWDLERMAVVDRNILRAAVYEMLWTAEVPVKVAINEAIEIAKKFGTKESSRFINGVLDRIHKELRPTP